jgi:hypothetical protein
MMISLRSAVKNMLSVLFWQNLFLDFRIRLASVSKQKPADIQALINRRRPNYTIWVPMSSISVFIPNSDLASVFGEKNVRKPNIPSLFWEGNWDLNVKNIDQYYRDASQSYRSVHQILKEGYHYTECDEYKAKLRTINNKKSTARGSSVDELNSYFENLLDIVESVKNDGYQSQNMINGDPNDEVGVFIGRDGDIIKPEDKFSGTHRFAIARCLGIESICVQILAVHEDWAQKHLHLLAGPKKKLEQHFN